MRNVLCIFGCLLMLAVLSGCNGKHQAQKGDEETADANRFPESIAGRWVSDRDEWGVEISRDGSITFVLHTLCPEPISVKEGGYYVEGPEDMYSYFQLGDCQADYDPVSRNLKVKIILASFDTKLQTKSITGRCEDYFEGPVSKNGKTWHADWRGYAYVDGAAEPNRKEIDANPIKLVFTKIVLDK